MKTRFKFPFPPSKAVVWLVLVMLLPTEGSPGDQRLADLVARAADKSTWPALQSLAQGLTDPEQRGRAYFVLGFREYEANDFKSAASDLKAAVDTGFSLSDFARYYGALAARDAGDPEQGIAMLEEFSARHPRSTLRWAALQQLSRLYTDTKQPDKAVKLLLQEPRATERPELYFELAQAYRAAGKSQDAVRSFQEIYYRFPLAAEADDAKEALTELRKELGRKFIDAAEDLQSSRADIFSRNSRWRQALSEYSELLEDLPESSLVLRWKLGKARSLFRLRKTDQAVKILKTELPPTPETEPERLQLLVEAAFRNSDVAGAEKYLGTLRQTYPKSSGYAQALDAFGNYYARRGDWKTAAGYYQPLAENFPTTDQGREAQWRRTWSFYLEGDLNRARAGFAQHLSLYPAGEHVPGALYWLGRVDEQRGAVEDARAWFSFLSRRYVQSYFADKANQRLEELRKTNPAPSASENVPASLLSVIGKIPAKPSPGLGNCGRAGANDLLQPYFVLRSLGLTDLAEQYLLDRLEEANGDSTLRFTLSRARSERGATTLALYDARRSLPRYTEFQVSELPEEFWSLLYPRDYLAIVDRYAQELGLDPRLVLGLIRQESAFNPQARSVANARGLMQILPSTVSNTRRGRNLAARRLLEPEYNIKFGTQYLRGRLSVLDEIPEQAVAAYHAGEGRVQEWRSQHSFQEPAEFLESIPIPSTRVYVEAVLRDAVIYRRLLDSSTQFAKCQ